MFSPAGSPNRPALPAELVKHIMRLENFTRPSPEFLVKFHGPLEVASHSEKVEKIWLTTISKHQGLVSRPEARCWSWFDVAVLSPAIGEDCSLTYDDGKNRWRVKVGEDGALLQWTSHYNPIKKIVFDTIHGPTFGPDHDIWSNLDVGDAIGVLGCAKFPMWKCIGKEATLDFSEFFDPTTPSHH
ncbi:hypothetical protein BD410DRAFT_164419 [Rickenella mellea]|uniref:Uncharacterized protein n=1 Tax=Rickenella mellea TaxID=50990 RepID=A0A4Y7Q8K6_9AGAM|nr:hypothetical protein BD410DRAFT_164419 [Rickenella mellea]